MTTNSNINAAAEKAVKSLLKRKCPICEETFETTEYLLHMLEEIAQSAIRSESMVSAIAESFLSYIEYMQSEDNLNIGTKHPDNTINDDDDDENDDGSGDDKITHPEPKVVNPGDIIIPDIQSPGELVATAGCDAVVVDKDKAISKNTTELLSFIDNLRVNTNTPTKSQD